VGGRLTFRKRTVAREKSKNHARLIEQHRRFDLKMSNVARLTRNLVSRSDNEQGITIM